MTMRIRRIGRALAQAFHAMNTERRIRVTKNLYFQIPKLKINLVSIVGEDSQNFELTIPEARMIFESMKSALQSKECKQIEFNELVWTTDCRVHVENPESITIYFKSPETSMQAVLQRENVAATLAEFERKLFSAL